LFKKTNTSPIIYWLPLTEEEAEQRMKFRAEEREKWRQDREVARPVRRSPPPPPPPRAVCPDSIPDCPFPNVHSLCHQVRSPRGRNSYRGAGGDRSRQRSRSLSRSRSRSPVRSAGRYRSPMRRSSPPRRR
jgi:hypothetical protein